MNAVRHEGRVVASLEDEIEDRHRRQLALARYEILDTGLEAEFDAIVKAAAAACGMPLSLINLIDRDRQWAKAMAGDGPKELPLSTSICALAIAYDDGFEIPDATQDVRIAGNPLVTGKSHLRFYAGVPLKTPEGIAIGTLCVADDKPGQLTDAQRLILRTLAQQVMTALELRVMLRQHRRSDHRSKAILESAVDYAIVSLDLTGHVTSWNIGAERILGWTEAEMCGQPAHLFFTDEDIRDGIPEQEMGQALLHGRGNDERWHRRKDGSRFYALGEMMPLKDEDGAPDGFIKILRDHTEQRLAAETQRADAEFMRGVLASSADCIKVLDLDANLTFMSEGGMRVMEVSDFNAIKGCPWPDFWAGQGNADAIAAVAAARAGGVGHFQGGADTMAGNPRWWDVQVTPILGADGKPERLLSVSRDITEQKTAETKLAASEERWRGLFTSMQEGFFLGELVRDAGGRAIDYRFLEINPAFARQSGLPADCIGKTIRTYVPDIDQGLIDNVARVVETGDPTLVDVDVPGLDRWFEVRIGKDRGERFSCLFLDISARKLSDVRRAAMTELGDRLRDLSDKAEVLQVAAQVLGPALRLAHTGYGEVDQDRETISVTQGWAAPGLSGLDGLFQFRDYGSYIEELKEGEAVVIDDVSVDPRTAADADTLAAIDIRALLNLPLMEHAQFKAVLYVAKSAPHAWTPEEISFVRNVADRTRATLARIEAEARQRTLNLELSHRMKNMLAMVQSIATQTMRGAADLDTARDVLANRLIALGKSHDLLLGGTLSQAPLTSLIERVLDIHRDRSDRFVIDGPTVMIGSKAALSLSLMLHELATNAAKYGALSNANGRVTITWRIDEDGRDAPVTIRWVEAGGPSVVAPKRTGFGTRLIGRGLAGSFDGEVALIYPATGVVCTIVAPLRGLMASETTEPIH
ncbi:PAS domain-containing protein [Methylobacterium sp. J-048]|uniref:PAS domain-containing protein n=1 Tax=Methylobacterium sp. J-048 TaxID=2836635 RepID=UPI001FBA5A2F|nr:PAS domain-containing protein [Methylobacterium sp. J-048]MCJ2058733.1 PAS domain-containing protein [Methylobacterium sp. J-048]